MRPLALDAGATGTQRRRLAGGRAQRDTHGLNVQNPTLRGRHGLDGRPTQADGCRFASHHMRVSSTPTPAGDPLMVVPRRGQAVMPAARDALAERGGEPVVDLAGRLPLSAGTVRNYGSSAMQKLGAHSRAEAIKVAEDKGWL
jgi:hypothetical protein